MPKITKIYTRSGDDGMTSLGSRERVSKDVLRVEVYGEIDELNSLIGMALAAGLDSEIEGHLIRIQNELFNMGTVLAFSNSGSQETQLPKIEVRHIELIESLIDKLNQTVGPLDNFILPGGTTGAAALHVARSVCRRAERSLVKLSRLESLEPLLLTYINRLSDGLFIMARFENNVRGKEDIMWNSRL